MTATTAGTRGKAPARTDAGPKSKRAAKVADAIVEDVIAMGWPDGQILGSEAELLERYLVSRELPGLAIEPPPAGRRPAGSRP